MNKVNFDGFKNINVPEAWIENALAVPEDYRKKPIPFSEKHKRVLTVVACVLMVSIMSVPLYLFEKTEVSIPYLSVTKSKDNLNTEDLTYYSGTEDIPDSAVQSPYFTDEFTSGTTIDYRNTFPTDNTSVSQNSTQPIPTAVPTQGGTEGITFVTKPSFTPTNPPIPTTQKPTEPRPTTPEPTKPAPTEASTGHYISMVSSCAGSFNTNGMMSSDAVEVIYCCLYDSRGNLVGDPNLYSFEHIAKDTPMANGYIFASYDPLEKGLELKEGTYKFYFYLAGWKVVFEGNITVF